MENKFKITGSTVIPKDIITQVQADTRYSYYMPFFEFTKLLKYYNGTDDSVGADTGTDNASQVGY